jgi:hypothetical protein
MVNKLMFSHVSLKPNIHFALDSDIFVQFIFGALCCNKHY